MTDLDVRLRKLELDDVDAVHSWTRLPEASRYQTWGPSTEAETRAFVETAVASWAERPQSRYLYAASLDGEVIGNGELKVRDRTHRQGEIAYIVHPTLWGKGIGTRIGQELLRIGFEEQRLHRIYATCDPRNLGSERVLRKLDMTYEGQLREVQWIRDGWRDSKLFSILESEWRPSGLSGK